MKKSVILIGVLLLILIGAYWYYQESQYEFLIHTVVDQDAKDRVPFSVNKGESVKSVAERLEKEGFISSGWALYKYVKGHDLGKEIEAGRFLLKKSYTIPEVADYLTRALGNEEPLTIREGLTIAQIDDYLAEEEILEDSAFEECAKNCVFDFTFLKTRPEGASLEGYLFPDTYFISSEGTSAEVLITRMLRNFEIKTSDLIVPENRTLHEIVTMASIIEKEEKKDPERPVISGILWKRYDVGMMLGADATVRFTLNKWTEPLYQKDLEVDSPYNTRKYAGLPPGPIGNPGLSSLKAALDPVESEYWYYLHGNDGMVRYAKTLEEHNINKTKFL